MARNASSNSNVELGIVVEDLKTQKDKCLWKSCKKESCKKLWHRPYYASTNLARRIRPVVICISVWETLIGVIFLIVVASTAVKFDQLYGTEEDEMISFLSFGGLVILVNSGIMLFVSILLSKRGVLWCYVLVSTFLSVYIFVLSIIMIHFALYNAPFDPNDTEFYLSKPCLIGILTLLGSVVHFLGTVVVFSYYSLKYIHPMMFEVK